MLKPTCYRERQCTNRVIERNKESQTDIYLYKSYNGAADIRNEYKKPCMETQLIRKDIIEK